MRQSIISTGRSSNRARAKYDSSKPSLTSGLQQNPLATSEGHTSDLPVELLRDIFRYTSPCEHREVIKLTCVCRTWRYTALDIAALFTHAVWDKWSAELLREWCRRAGQAGLEVMLTHKSVSRALEDHEFSRLLDDTSHRWVELFIEFDPTEDYSVSEVRSWLSRWECPQLRALTLCNLCRRIPNKIFHLPHNSAPSLENFSSRGSQVIRTTPWENLQRVSLDVHIVPGSDSQQEDIIRPVLHARIMTFDRCSFVGRRESVITLARVEVVSIIQHGSHTVEWLVPQHLSLPNATGLILCGLARFARAFGDYDKGLWVISGANSNYIPALISLYLRTRLGLKSFR